MSEIKEGDGVAPALLGPFQLSGERLGAQLESLLHALSLTLVRLEAGETTVELENARLEHREVWRTGLSFVLKRRAGRYLLEGFYVEVGSDYVTEEWPRIEREPPFVRQVLDALAEQVWWELLRDHLETEDFSPLLVLEWHSELSARAGVGLSGALTLIRLNLWRARSRHVSRFRLVGGPELEAGLIQEGLGLRFTFPAWWERAHRLKNEPEVPDPHRLAPVFLLTSGGEEMPLLDGWLGGELERMPSLGEDRRAAFFLQELRVHGLESLRKARLRQGVVAFVLSLSLGGAVGLALEQLSSVRMESTRALPEPVPIPALSFCSEDNQRFVQALRRWVVAFSPQDVVPDLAAEGDLTPFYCGLLDRQHDVSFAAGRQAAANACYEVLRTHSYAFGEVDAPAYGRAGWGNPGAFFDDERTKVPSLELLVRTMEDTCHRIVRQQEGQIKRAVVRAHLSPALRKAHPVLEAASREEEVIQPSSLPPIWKRLLGAGGDRSSFGEGKENGAATADRWLMRYVTTRFLPYSSREGGAMEVFRRIPLRRFSSEPLWNCYLSLLPEASYRYLTLEARPNPVPQVGPWNVRVSFPRELKAVSGSEQVMSQLELDATLLWLETGVGDESVQMASGYQCWSVVREELERQGYQRAYPLSPEPLEDWPVDDQQLCGQVCASVFGLEAGASKVGRDVRDRWLTPALDLQTCLSEDRFRDVAKEMGPPSLSLEMGFAGLKPTAAQACAFHLLAQDRFPMSGEERLSPLVTLSPRAWVGGDRSDRRVNSRRSYLVNYAQQAAKSLRQGSVGSSVFTVEGCQHAASQCLTTALLNAQGTAWENGRRSGSSPVTALEDALAQGLTDDPFCHLIERELSFLMENDFRLSERKAEDICLQRITDTYDRVLELSRRVSEGM